jgi:tryptophan halogenase
VVGATRRADGLLDELQFSDSSTLRADLYIDCSGFRGVLIEEIMGTGYLDWSAMLPCDRAVAFPTVSTAARPPYTNSLGERPLSDPRFLRFVTGRRKLLWNRNCVALGLASGFLEPLESTSIHMVMSGVYKLLEHFPDRSFDQANIDSYNSELIAESERIRDFIVLHYCLTQREDAPLWAYCRSMMLPDSLMQRIELYRRTGRIRVKAGELFTDLSWFYIFEGLGVRPDSYDPLMDVVTAGQLGEIMASMAAATAAAAKAAPSHDSYFAANTTTGSRAAAAP